MLHGLRTPRTAGPSMLALILFGASAQAQTPSTRLLLSPPMSNNNRYLCQIVNTTAQAVMVSRFEFVVPDALFAGSTLPLLNAETGNCSLLGGPLNFALPAGRACWIRVTLPSSINWDASAQQVSCRVRHSGAAGAVIGMAEARKVNLSTGTESDARLALPLQDLPAPPSGLP